MDVEAEIATFLATCRTASLATVDPGGSPCNANVQYAGGLSGRPFDLLWLSSPSSEHSRNIEPVIPPEGDDGLTAGPQDPRAIDAAVTIYGHLDDPESIHGVQMRGAARGMPLDLKSPEARAYAGKYPFVLEPRFEPILASQRLYRFRPNWLRWIDNRRGFGWRIEVRPGS